MKGVEVDNLINRLEAKHENALAERLAIAAADLEKADKDHAEVCGRLKAELEPYNEEIKDLLANQKQSHGDALAATLAFHASAISPKENHHTTAQKCLEEVEKALRTAKLEHSTALKTLGTDHAAALKAKDVELSEAIVKTKEEYYNALTKPRQDRGSPSLPWNGSRKNTPASCGLLRSLRKAHFRNLRAPRRTSSKSYRKLTLRPFPRRRPTLPMTWRGSRPNTRRTCLQLSGSTLLPWKKFGRTMLRLCRSSGRIPKRTPCD